MSPTPEERPEQVNELEALAAQIAALQGQIKELERQSSGLVSVPASALPGSA